VRFCSRSRNADANTVPVRAGNPRGGFRAFADGQTRSTKQSRLLWDLFRPTVPLPFRQANGTGSNGQFSTAIADINADPSAGSAAGVAGSGYGAS